MTPARRAQIKELFTAALETPEPQRSQFLESACGGDADLRAEVERLLAANEEPSLQSPAAELFAVTAELAAGRRRRPAHAAIRGTILEALCRALPRPPRHLRL